MTAVKVKSKKRVPVVSLEGRDSNARVEMTCVDRLVAPGGKERWGRGRDEKNFAECLRVLATDDRCDRGHLVRTGRDGLLVSAAGLNGQANPRKYPRGYMHEVVVGELREFVATENTEEYGGGPERNTEANDLFRTVHPPQSSSGFSSGPLCSRVMRIVERAVAIVSDETVFDETFSAQCRLAGALGVGMGKRMAVAVHESMALHPRLRDILEKRVRVEMSPREVELERLGSEMLGEGGG